MSNDIIRKQDNPLTVPDLQQTGTTNVAVKNMPGGTVNLTYNINYTQTSDSSAEKMIAIQNFSKEYYQVIVTCEEDVFNTCVVTVMSKRALTERLVPKEIYERCSSLSEEGIEELKRFPAIICRENTAYNGDTDPNQWAMLAYITAVRVYGKNIKVAFKPIQPIQQIKLCDKYTAVKLGINMECALTDLNCSAWYVNKANLLEELDKAGIPGIPKVQ